MRGTKDGRVFTGVWIFGALLGVMVAFAPCGAAANDTVPIRALTKGPRHHWFSYYDKLQFDPTGRFVLAMAVDFEHRSPRVDDVLEIGMIDLKDGDRWIPLGQSTAWGWQQGCMLQWRPGSMSEVVWNDREDGRYVCRILDVFTREKRTLPYPIYALSPDGRWAVSADFRRIQDMRPGYGYAGLPDPRKTVLAPADAGIHLVDLETGDGRLIVSLDQVSQIPYPKAPEEMTTGKNYFNHLLVNTDGTRFIFLHRWRVPQGEDSWSGFRTRLFTAAMDGSDVRLVDPHGRTSHFIWRDPETILAWAGHPSYEKDAFFLYEDRQGGRVDRVDPKVMPSNGHCTYLPGGEWILNDTYPQGKEREQIVYLYHIPTRKRVELGRFHLPPDYAGEWRCDTHPRSSPDGTKVTIDSPHGGEGRQVWLLDISGIVNSQ